jgi:hypothetical protein
MQPKKKTMKALIPILILLLIAGCAAAPTAASPASCQAAYLVQQPGQLSTNDLQSHPEVCLAALFDEFKALAQNKTTLWIDLNSAGLVDKDWLNQKSGGFYPIVLIGDGDALCALRDTLGGFGVISGPYADCSSPLPGFSVWMLEEQTSSSVQAFMRGYQQAPTVQDILEITDALLSSK